MTGEGSGTASLLGRGPFRWYLAALAITVTGNWAQNVALALVALDESGSATVVGLALSLRYLPLLLLGPWVGKHLDRYRKANIVAVAQAVAGTLTLAFFLAAIADAMSTALILVYSVGAGLCTVADVPSRVAMIGELVERATISKATATASVASVLGRVIGPAVATAIMTVSSPDWVFLVNAVSFFVTARIFRGVGAASVGRSHIEATPGHRSLRSVLRSTELSVPLAMALAMALFVLNTQVVLLVLLTEVLDRPESSYGMLLVVMGVGGAVGAVTGGRVRAPTVSFLAAVTAVAGLLLLVLSAAGFTAVVVAGALGGAVVGLFSTAASTYLQLAASDHERGWIMSLQEAAFTGAAPVGAAIAGVMTEVLGARQTFVGYAVAVLAVAGIGVVTATSGANAPEALDVGEEVP